MKFKKMLDWQKAEYFFSLLDIYWFYSHKCTSALCTDTYKENHILKINQRPGRVKKCHDIMNVETKKYLCPNALK